MVAHIKICNLIGISCVLVVCLVINISAVSEETESQKVETAVEKPIGQDDKLKLLQKRSVEPIKHGKKHNKQHKKKHRKKHTRKNDVPQNVTTATGTTTNDTEDSIYANKKTDVNQKAMVVGEEKGPKAKPSKVNPAEVADNDLKTGVIITIIIVIIAFLGCGAVMWGRREQIKGILSSVKDKVKKEKGED
ncbi:uncharacterized protein LOC133191140 [Saccostrea echinata]|uniref:uncharacterized protein LOC133191140 n=1 Tax=Saccostrea echinata TaxID=191078 RepID=UPI002A803BE8|nr:uncharacterized protein LOC133191140 [Saccostrea echinata]